MRKHNVFLVTGRLLDPAPPGPTPRGDLVERVVCAQNEEALHQYCRRSFPGFVVIGVVSLASLEQTADRIKAALSGGAGELPVFVDSAFQTSPRRNKNPHAA